MTAVLISILSWLTAHSYAVGFILFVVVVAILDRLLKGEWRFANRVVDFLVDKLSGKIESGGPIDLKVPPKSDTTQKSGNGTGGTAAAILLAFMLPWMTGCPAEGLNWANPQTRVKYGPVEFTSGKDDSASVAYAKYDPNGGFEVRDLAIGSNASGVRQSNAAQLQQMPPIVNGTWNGVQGFTRELGYAAAPWAMRGAPWSAAPPGYTLNPAITTPQGYVAAAQAQAGQDAKLGLLNQCLSDPDCGGDVTCGVQKFLRLILGGGTSPTVANQPATVQPLSTQPGPLVSGATPQPIGQTPVGTASVNTDKITEELSALRQDVKASAEAQAAATAKMAELLGAIVEQTKPKPIQPVHEPSQPGPEAPVETQPAVTQPTATQATSQP